MAGKVKGSGTAPAELYSSRFERQDPCGKLSVFLGSFESWEENRLLWGFFLCHPKHDLAHVFSVHFLFSGSFSVPLLDLTFNREFASGSLQRYEIKECWLCPEYTDSDSWVLTCLSSCSFTQAVKFACTEHRYLSERFVTEESSQKNPPLNAWLAFLLLFFS